MICQFLYSCNAKVSEKTHAAICITEKHKQCETYHGAEVKRPCEWSVKIRGGRVKDLPEHLQRILAPPSTNSKGERIP